MDSRNAGTESPQDQWMDWKGGVWERSARKWLLGCWPQCPVLRRRTLEEKLVEQRERRERVVQDSCPENVGFAIPPDRQSRRDAEEATVSQSQNSGARSWVRSE